MRNAPGGTDGSELRRAESTLNGLRWLGLAAFPAIAWTSEAIAYPRWLAAAYAGAVLYGAAATLLARSRLDSRRLALFTTVGDAAVVVCWCAPSGGILSDFYPYFYLTLLAASIRFGLRETFLALLLNGLLTIALFVLTPEPPQPARELGIRLYYLVFLSLMGASLSEAARRHLETAVRARDRQQQLFWRMIAVGEEERKRIAGEIHDRVGGSLFEVYQGIDRWRARFPEMAPEAADGLRRLAEDARHCADQVRDLTTELRPQVLDDFGFVEALREYAAFLAERDGLAVDLDVEDDLPRLGRDVDVMLYRVLQEAIVNVRKHARARHVRIELAATSDGQVRLIIADDGVGFDPARTPRGHLGLLYVRERVEGCGGSMRIESAQGRGTTLEVVVPAEGRTG